MKTCKLALIIVLFFISQFQTKAQAYDGSIDKKIIVGYCHVGNKPGLDLKYENGYSDLISAAVTYIYLFYDTPSAKDNGDKAEYFIQKSDFGLYLNFHLFQKQISSTKLDIYAGPDFMFKSLGVQAGIKYNFSERVGLYFQILQSYSNSLYGLNSPAVDPSNNFGKKTNISAGITYSVY